MVDLSLPELAVVAVMALLVLGPERLPGAARTAGALVRRAQRSWSSLRADIERELAADELKRQLRDTRESIGVDAIRRDLEQAQADIGRGIDPRPLPGPEGVNQIAPAATPPHATGAMATGAPADPDPAAAAPAPDRDSDERA